MDGKLNILIVENQYEEFLKIKNSLEESFGSAISVSPLSRIENSSPNFQNFDTLMEDYLQVSKFDDVLKEFNYIDLFILDIALIGNSDEIGMKFRDKIKEKHKKRGYRIIFISRNRKNYYKIDDTVEDFLPKHMNKPLVDRITQLIEKKFKLKTVSSTKKPGKKDRPSLDEWLQSSGQWLHNLIMISFYLILFVTMLYAVVQIGKDFIFSQKSEIISNSQTTHPGDTTVVSGDTIFRKNEVISNGKIIEGTINFEKIEHIFLYLIPFFVVFGLFNYYRSYLSVYLLDDNFTNIDPDESARAMHLTKVLFTSSIISYTVIKTIEEIFFSPSGPSITKLISSGSILLLLMSFYFVIDRKHKNHDDHKTKP